jgi:transcriptional regulator with AAA-type ATPase domain
MSKSRSGKSNFSAALEQSAQPVYWLDDRLRLRYANSAMLHWLDWNDQPWPETAMTFGSGSTDTTRDFPADLAPPPLPPDASGPETIPAEVARLGSASSASNKLLRPFAGIVCRHYSPAQPPKTAVAWFLPLADRQRPERNGWLAWLECYGSEQAKDAADSDGVQVLQQTAATLTNAPQRPVLTMDQATCAWRDPLAPAEIQAWMLQVRHQEQNAWPSAHLSGPSAIAKRLRRQVEIAAAVQTPLLISGPRGAGKEALMRQIFARRKLKFQLQQPALVTLHCRLADPELVQETWRHLLRAAGNEPPHLLLLDIEQLSGAAAHELWGLLTIPTVKVIPVATANLGGPNPSHTNTSALPTAAASLAAHPTSQSGLGSQLPIDLWQTLNCQRIELPSLVERLQDLPHIVQSGLEALHRSESAIANGFSPAAMQYLVDYDWPGHIEQLEQVIEECLKNCTQPLIDVPQLPKTIVYAVQSKRQGRNGPLEIDLDKYLESIERLLLERALQQAKYNRAAAARNLNISRARLLRRCEQLDVHFPFEPVEFVLDETEESNDSAD